MKAGRRQRVVLVTPIYPAARGNGLAMRAGLFLRGLARSCGVSVVVVPVLGPPAPVDGLTAECARSVNVLVPVGSRRSVAAMLLATPEGRARARDLYPLPALCPALGAADRAALAALIDGAALVHVCRSYLAPCLDELWDDPERPPVSLDLDDLDSAVQHQFGDAEQGARYERLERYYTARADRVYTASAPDAEIVRDRYGSPATAVANAVSRPSRAEPGPRSDLLFVGNLSYEPNVDALRWLCGEIRPRLGPAQIAVVGSRPGPEIRGLDGLNGVAVAADVPEVGPWYAGCRLAVAPIRIGGGTRVKIVEALAHGRPVVSTTLGARGLPVGERHGVLVADTADAFAATCRELLADPDRCERLGTDGRRSVVTAKHVVNQIDALTRELITAGPRPRRTV